MGPDRQEPDARQLCYTAYACYNACMPADLRRLSGLISPAYNCNCIISAMHSLVMDRKSEKDIPRPKACNLLLHTEQAITQHRQELTLCQRCQRGFV